MGDAGIQPDSVARSAVAGGAGAFAAFGCGGEGGGAVAAGAGAESVVVGASVFGTCACAFASALGGGAGAFASALGVRRGGCRCPGHERRDVFVRLGDDRDKLAYGNRLTFGRENLPEDTGTKGLQLDLCLVRFDGGQHVSTLDPIPLLLQPLQDPSLHHGIGELRHDHL